MNHTPGPWHVVADPQWVGKHPNHASRFICNVPAFEEVYPPTPGEDDGWQVFHGAHGRTICQMMDTQEISANARLIASAPELLASLIELESMVAEMLPKHGPCGWGELALEQARAAIAKAKGLAIQS